ncbi:phosphatidylglycerol lysyltransferase domain-containing protein [Petroclostridium sp. X23]|uniref:DUF2156 domain-containing protein n=1 Tax=Petroclostridium sp. X23 TaxID=3045146 RepID=UPI0024AC958F|nr:phosphatidylglycerol lysyltransferase domain-containing protein [Petroclostridium sp. X23]WHH60600.1 phosphatidylglycerol lysyltransferase domain-containing protein [Petroclostridium sp. X23]
MIELKDITIDSKELFDKYLALKKYEISDMTFTNLFMWRKSYNIKYTLVEDYLCIFAQYEKNPPFILMPIGEGQISPVLEKVNAYFESRGNNLVIKSLIKGMMEEIEKEMPSKFEYKADRSTFDYVYDSSDLIHLEGKKYHSKRNHINKFVSGYDYTYYPLTSDLIDDCIKVAEEWCAKRNCAESKGLEQEKSAIIDALNHFEKLAFKGGVIKVADKVIAFTYGEQFTDDMAVIHVEKADADIPGAYTIINQKFCENEWSNVKYINREEDLGIPGLRKAKQSYKPVRLIEKYTGILVK